VEGSADVDPGTCMAPRLPSLLAAILALLLTATTLSAGTALADQVSVRDADDVDGRLDLAKVSHSHTGHVVEHTIKMQAGWRARVLKPGTLTVLFKSGSRYRTLWVDYRRHRLRARICTTEAAGGGATGRCTTDVGLTRPDGRSLEVSLRRGQVRKPGRAGYKWQVTTFLEGGEGECPRTRLCVDELPGADPWIRHGFGG